MSPRDNVIHYHNIFIGYLIKYRKILYDMLHCYEATPLKGIIKNNSPWSEF